MVQKAQAAWGAWGHPHDLGALTPVLGARKDAAQASWWNVTWVSGCESFVTSFNVCLWLLQQPLALEKTLMLGKIEGRRRRR